jgi:hypothetical protein
MIKAAMTISLSAIGSKNLPNIVTIPILRARYPSSQSVTDANEKTTAAQKPDVCDGVSSIAAINGIAAILVIVRIFGRLRIGESVVEDIAQLA